MLLEIRDMAYPAFITSIFAQRLFSFKNAPHATSHPLCAREPHEKNLHQLARPSAQNDNWPVLFDRACLGVVHLKILF
jgi:hypothetical protein